MDMQDNEFDGLFRNKLNGFESEPSEKVWPRINTELGKKKIAILPWLSVAASITVLVSAWILFIPKAQKAGHNSEHIVKVMPKISVTKPAEQVVLNTPVKHEEAISQAQKINTKEYKRPITAVPAPVTPDETLVKNERAKPVEQPELIASVVPPKTEPVKQGVVPGSETQLIAKQNVNTDSAMNAKPALIAKAPTALKPETQAVKKHGIRNFGELVNLVVARVDKRKDKAVEFTDDDDGDGSTLTAVNIGPVKIGKEDKGER
ncbi:MAG TPA: hypothetical protein VHS53_12255 [Mucilaginibacter sp.]|nr:hypothetical protein [Mucilaginibacter sp.]